SSSITSSNPEIAALKLQMEEMNRNLTKMLQTNQQVNAVTPSCETCGGPHSYNDCPATVGQTQNVYVVGAYNQGGNSYQPQGNRNLLSYRSDNYLGPPGFNVNQNQNRSNQNQNYQNRNQGNNQGNNYQGNNQGRNQFFQGASRVQNPPPAYQAPPYQAPVHQAPIPQPQVEKTNEFKTYMDANDAILKNMQTNITTLTNSNLELKNMFGQFMKMNTASSSGSGTLPSNTVTNPREDLKGITTRSGVAYQGPTIPTTSSSPPKVVERETEPVVDPVSAPMPNPKPSISYPSRRNNERRREKANDQIEKFYEIFKDLSFEISLTDALILMPKFASTLKALIGNKEKLSEMARTPLNEHCSAVLLKKLPKKLGDPGKFLIPCDFPGMDECLALADLGASINLMPLSVWKKLSLPELTPTCVFLESISYRCDSQWQSLSLLSEHGIVSTSSPTLTPFEDSNFLLEMSLLDEYECGNESDFSWNEQSPSPSFLYGCAWYGDVLQGCIDIAMVTEESQLQRYDHLSTDEVYSCNASIHAESAIAVPLNVFRFQQYTKTVSGTYTFQDRLQVMPFLCLHLAWKDFHEIELMGYCSDLLSIGTDWNYQWEKEELLTRRIVPSLKNSSYKGPKRRITYSCCDELVDILVEEIKHFVVKLVRCMRLRLALQLLQNKGCLEAEMHRCRASLNEIGCCGFLIGLRCLIETHAELVDALKPGDRLDCMTELFL
ncbi:hypothetical protein Tco_0816521, partial [Tanacetum coccineum]